MSLGALASPADTESALIAAARRGDQEAFRRLAEPLRSELQLHCYRMLGSRHDAEDVLQNALLRAWQKIDTFRGRGSFRSWLYTIATNAARDELRRRPRRILPSGYGPPADPADAVRPDVPDPIWLTPYPDTLLNGVAAGPEARYTLRESVSLAFLATIQLLSPRQRAVLILRDVLGWRAADVARSLHTSTASVNSALQRARQTLRRRFPAGARDEGEARERSEAERSLLRKYLRAWEAGDAAALAALLAEEAILTMPPTPSWYAGRDAVARFFARVAFSGELGGRLHLVPTGANLQPACAVYRRDRDNIFRAMAIQVFTIDRGAISEITGFVDPGLFPSLGLPAAIQVGEIPRGLPSRGPLLTSRVR